MKFLLCQRKGRKWVAIAGTNSGNCLAAARNVFEFQLGERVADGQVRFADRMESQKNYAGQSPDFQVVEAEAIEVDVWRARKHADQFGIESALNIWGDTVTAEMIQPTDSENTNCLAGWRCPHCGKAEQFRIEAVIHATVTMCDSGTIDEDIEGTTWGDTSECECLNCGHCGVVQNFDGSGRDHCEQKLAVEGDYR